AEALVSRGGAENAENADPPNPRPRPRPRPGPAFSSRHDRARDESPVMNTRGLTLMELVVALAITGLIMAAGYGALGAVITSARGRRRRWMRRCERRLCGPRWRHG